MNTQLHISYLGLVRIVIGSSEEEFEVLAATTVGLYPACSPINTALLSQQVPSTPVLK